MKQDFVADPDDDVEKAVLIDNSNAFPPGKSKSGRSSVTMSLLCLVIVSCLCVAAFVPIRTASMDPETVSYIVYGVAATSAVGFVLVSALAKKSRNHLSDSTFQDKVVWLTGASSGIGENCAKLFHRHGAQVILSGRREKELQRVANTCDALRGGRRPIVLPFDLKNIEGLEQIAKDALKVSPTSRIDILVLSGGIATRALVEETSLQIDIDTMKINYFSNIALTKAILPSMLKNRSGHVAVISSAKGRIGMADSSTYCATKHALMGFYDAFRTEVSSRGIKVTSILPGAVNTNVIKNALAGDGKTYGKDDKNNLKGIAPEECARRIVVAIKNEDPEAIIAGAGARFCLAIRGLFPTVCFSILAKKGQREVLHVKGIRAHGAAKVA